MNQWREEIKIWQQDLDEICPNAYNPDNQNSLAIERIPKDRVDEVQSIVEEIERLRQQSKLARDEQKISPEQCDQEQIARRYDNRAGFDLVNYTEVGLPVYKITVQALTQIRKPIPPIEEYVLKAIHAGLSSEQDIDGFLGLEPSILREAMIGAHSGMNGEH